MSTTTSMMFRSASRRARSLAERVGRDASHVRSRQAPLGSGKKVMFSTRDGDSGGILAESHQFTQHPIPLPAVAYAYYDDDDDYEYDDGSGSISTVEALNIHFGVSNPLSQQDVNSMSSSAYHDATFGNTTDANVIFGSSIGNTAGRGSSSKPYTTGESTTSTTSRKFARGGGGGRHRCPKCGTTVTFRCDFEENTFYCASCSGWFVANPNTIVSIDSKDKGDGSVYEEFMARNGAKRPEDPKILMRHVRWYRKKLLTFLFLLLTLVLSSRQIPDTAKRYAAGRGRSSQNSQMAAEEQVEEQVEPVPESTAPPSVKRIPTPREIRRGLNEYVIGQGNVKVALSVGVYNHYKRIFVSEAQAAAESRKAQRDSQEEYFPLAGDGGLSDLNLSQFGSKAGAEGDDESYCEAPDVNSIADEGFGTDVEDVEIDKSNIMLLGPTGSGKTHLVKTLARLIDVPLVIADATCLTQAGYVGEDVESVLFKVRDTEYLVSSVIVSCL
jgi:predicted RNA-binding Zn-ribbon protein involved in translation (DUF1610 family)